MRRAIVVPVGRCIEIDCRGKLCILRVVSWVSCRVYEPTVVIIDSVFELCASSYGACYAMLYSYRLASQHC